MKHHHKVKSNKFNIVNIEGSQTIELYEVDKDGFKIPYTTLSFARELNLKTKKWSEWRTDCSIYHPVERVVRLLRMFNKIKKLHEQRNN